MKESFDDIYSKGILPRELKEEMRAFENESIPVLTKSDGNCFSPSTPKGIRAGIQQYLTSPEVNRSIRVSIMKVFFKAWSINR